MKTTRTTSEPMDTTGFKRVKLPPATAQGAVFERPRLLPRNQHGRRVQMHPHFTPAEGSALFGSYDDLNYRKTHKRRY